MHKRRNGNFLWLFRNLSWSKKTVNKVAILFSKNSNAQEGLCNNLGCIKRMGGHMKHQGLDHGECLSNDCVTNEYCKDNSYVDLSLISWVCDPSLSLNPISSQFSTPAISPPRAYSKYVKSLHPHHYHSPATPRDLDHCSHLLSVPLPTATIISLAYNAFSTQIGL